LCNKECDKTFIPNRLRLSRIHESK
jgi:hypothetical protein